MSVDDGPLEGWVKNNLVELALRFGLDLADLIEQNHRARSEAIAL